MLALPGAVAADPPDAGVAAHYGDPMREQRALVAEAGVVDRSHRGVLRVTGPERLSWLHSVTTQHVSELPPHTPTELLVLDPHGRVEHHALVIDDGEATWLDVEPATAPALLGYLKRMQFWAQAEPADVTEECAVLSLLGPGVADVLASAGIDVLVRPTAGPGPGGADLLVPRPRLADVHGRLVAAGATPAGVAAYEALRVAARVPRLGLETDHKTIPHEVGWIGVAVHLNKGCYRGQETVARVHNLGRPPRRLVLLHLDGREERLPGHGEPVTSQDIPVGYVGTPAMHHELGPLALAVVKRNTPDDVPLRAGGVAAAVDAA